MTKIIAEFCQNHNGNFDLLSKMVEQAAEAGATHGKMQTIFADTITYRPQFESGLVQDGKVKSIKRPYDEEYQRLKGLEISDVETENFVSICKDHDLIPMTTCFVRSHVDRLSELGFRSIKVASYDCASFPLITDLKGRFDEIVISTGATFDDEVKKTSKILSGENFAFLHCVTLYPTPLNMMHMARMDWLRTLAPSVGYSDHSLVSETGLLASKAALVLGAEIIERHFTLLKPEETRDGPVSINKTELQELSDFAQLSNSDKLMKMEEEYPEWEVVIGERERKMSDEELLNRDYYRGRYASPRPETMLGRRMIYNWEDVRP